MDKLTQEMYEISKNSRKTCLLFNREYVLLNKFMPVTDDKLEDYLKKIYNLKQKGVNTCQILDYKLNDNCKYNYFDGNIKYSKGIFLEERAPGNSFDSVSDFEIINDKLINKAVTKYIQELDRYISELERRANADQIIYDKLVNDFIEIFKCNLSVDPRPNNFFFDKEIGYTIINLIPIDNKETPEDLPQYLIHAIFGYGRPKLFKDQKLLNYMCREYHDKLFKFTNKIIRKYKCALLKCGYLESSIKKCLYLINDYLCLDNIMIVENNEIINYILSKKEKILKK